MEQGYGYGYGYGQTQTTRYDYRPNEKPSLNRVTRNATRHARVISQQATGYNRGVQTIFDNGTKITTWNSRDAYGRVVQSTSVQVGNKTYFDWESDGRIDTVNIIENRHHHRQEPPRDNPHNNRPHNDNRNHNRYYNNNYGY